MPDGDPDRLADLDDQALMARHADGDDAAFAEVVRRHRDRLWAVALRTVGDREEAADAVQDALLSALRAGRSGAFRGDAAVTTWLHRIVVNACLDRVRRRSVRPADPLGEDAARLPDPVDPVGRQETAIVVAAALATLPVEQRAALVLVDMHGYSVEEAARLLGCAPGTIKSRCARGRAKLLPVVSDLRAARNHGPGGDVPADERTSPAGRTPRHDEEAGERR
ncbi:MAG TPA: RNA polymerase sigma factor SigM [Actinomycetes bacterium]|nr:RNA polymerase sigma factor SigM [Actinomycetes bacterium]